MLADPGPDAPGQHALDDLEVALVQLVQPPPGPGDRLLELGQLARPLRIERAPLAPGARPPPEPGRPAPRLRVGSSTEHRLRPPGAAAARSGRGSPRSTRTTPPRARPGRAPSPARAGRRSARPGAAPARRA